MSMAGRFHRLEVAYVRPETADAIVVGFRPDDRGAFAFRPGQYLTLRAEIEGQRQQRCYSICSTPDDPAIEVAIKRVPGGRFSPWAHRALRAGDAIDVLAPEGRFGLTPQPGAARSHLAIAAGSGVTPILSLARALLAAEPASHFTFLYGNRARETIMFREALDDLKDRHMGRFALIHMLSGEARDVELLHGRIDADRLARLARAGLIAPAGADAIFLCGPGDLANMARAALLQLGADPACIQTERFLPTPGSANAQARPEPACADLAGSAMVTAIVDGAERRFRMEAADPSLILAAERAGIELPSSCRGGMCCTCRARVLKGAAKMAVNYSLEPWELEAGFVLACQARPTTAELTLDFDAV